jgi:hypothetical protein
MKMDTRNIASVTQLTKDAAEASNDHEDSNMETILYQIKEPCSVQQWVGRFFSPGKMVALHGILY